jgi:hypothetical protein
MSISDAGVACSTTASLTVEAPSPSGAATALSSRGHCKAFLERCQRPLYLGNARRDGLHRTLCVVLCGRAAGLRLFFAIAGGRENALSFR